MSDNNEQNKQRLTLCAKWMTGFSEIYGREVTKEMIRLYSELLADISIETLEIALRLASQSCTRFPTVADIRGQVQKQVVAEDQMHAEMAWDLVQRILSKHWHPDIGFHSNPPEIDGPTEHALRQVGGYRRLNETPVDNLNFIRRDFLEAFKRYRETAGYLAPSRQEAAAFLDSLKRGELPS